MINGRDSEEAKHIDNNSMVNAANFGDKLFDMEKDPKQIEQIFDKKIEVRMENLLQRAMLENECPPEQFERIGISGDKEITEEDIEVLHEKEKQLVIPVILPEYQWTKGAINTYRALMKFIPADQKENVISTLSREIPKYAKKEIVTPLSMVLAERGIRIS